jgi:phospholipid/cholesterol/gamma-HCH transport system permease protein
MNEARIESLTREGIADATRALEDARAGDGPVTLDLAAVKEADSAGAALLSVFAKKMEAVGRNVRLLNVAPNVRRTLDLFPFAREIEPAREAPVGFRESVGSGSFLAFEVLVDFLMLAADTTFFAVQGLFQRRGIRWQTVLYEMASMGSRALGVVGLIAFLVGGTMALQSAAQLRQFGANIFVVDLVAISMVRELGPLMAAIVVAGRSGSAVAAEIGTMVITEEIDALKTMGLHPTRFLIVPKILAISITQPLLTVLADLLGIAGGFAVAITYLEVSPNAFVNRLEQAMFTKDILTGLVKSLIFAELIVTVGALCGLRTRGGADAVGRSTTTSVVAGIFAVITADALASLVFYFGD